MSALLKDIRFWIVFFFAIRIYGITLPPLEVIHNIRQTDGLMIARNFYERSNNIFYPTVDVAGEKSGIVGCEFPLLNYLIYLMSEVFGFENWFGRIINLTVSSFGVFFFFKLIKNHFNESVAFNAAILLTVSLWFTYSRKNIPDTFSVSLCIGSLYFALQYFEKGKWYELLLYFLLALLGCLSKISAAAILTVLAIPVFFGKYSIQRKVLLSVLSAAILMTVYWWYFVWVPYLNDTYGYKMFFMGMPISEGLGQILEAWPKALSQLSSTPLKYTGLATFLLGIFFIVRKKAWLPLAVFCLPFSFFLIVIFKSGVHFTVNEYYMVLIAPAMAFVAGWGVAQLNKKALVTFILVVVSIEGIANKIHDFRIKQPLAALEDLEPILDKVSQRSDLIAINGGAESGTAMFLAHRRGWRVLPELFNDKAYMDYLKSNECKFILIIRKHPWVDVNLRLPVAYESEYFKIYNIQ
jgi:4-amino-4-deoxy-L-arabinose transferase-like glycosyltransferase